MISQNEWVVWLNGNLVPEREAMIPFRDRGFKYGDAVYDTTRTFGHRIFKLDEHLDRLFRSLAYTGLKPGLTKDEFARATEAVVEHNLKLVPADEDIWITQRVSRGLDAADRSAFPEYPDCTIIVECRPLPYQERAAAFRDGIEVITPSMRRPAPDTVSPRAKISNYMNLILADLEVKRTNPSAQPVLLDTNGNLAEGRGSNIFLVQNGRVLTPKERYVLPGISRETTIELAEKLAIPCEEADIDLYDAVNADEAFITSTSWCICPIRSINGHEMRADIPGPITRNLMDGYVELVDCDWVGQYLKYA
ncbi:MAG: aminotransferase class IV [Proteobacteria bacterium]|nr:aminotransferase class IV [Pseudomonadota bacterium]